MPTAPVISEPTAATRSSSAPTVPESGMHHHTRPVGDYEAQVRARLIQLGSGDPDGDIRSTRKFLEGCVEADIGPEVCAANIYTAVKHKHGAGTILREVSAATEDDGAKSTEEPNRFSGRSDSVGWTGWYIESSHGRYGAYASKSDALKARKRLAKSSPAYARRGALRIRYIESGATEAGRKDVDDFSLHQLDLYLYNESKLYPQRKAIQSAMRSKAQKGTYNPAKAAAEWAPWVEAGAKAYAKEYAKASEWNVMFPKALRDELASEIAKREHEEFLIQGGKSRLNEGAAEKAPVISEKGPKTPAAAVCTTCIPWVKVTRDPAKHAEHMELSAKHGPIKTAKDVYTLVGHDLMKDRNEVFLLIPLNVRSELCCPPYEIARGQTSRVHVEAVDVVRAALDSSCESFFIVHQHPTGKCTPSRADRQLTRDIQSATKIYGKSLRMVDHVVIGNKQCFSILSNRCYKM
jgi:hypothetical protein